MKNYFQAKHLLFLGALLVLVIGSFYFNPVKVEKAQAGCWADTDGDGVGDTTRWPSRQRIEHGWCALTCTTQELIGCRCDPGYHIDPNDDAVCVLNTGNPLSGTLSPDISTCTIPTGGSSCSQTLTWATTNPPAGSASVVTNSGGATPNPGPSINSGSQSFSIPHTDANIFINFSLKNGTTLLSTSLVDARCATGDTWIAGKCTGATLPDLTASTPPQNTAVIGIPQTFTSIITNNQI